jgi:predicted acyltransferase
MIELTKERGSLDVTETGSALTPEAPETDDAAIAKDAQAAPLTGRLLSLDVFRGMTIAAMVLVNNPGTWQAVYAPLQHAHWDGWTPTDLVFPFFVFIVGVAIPLAFERRKAAGGNQRDLYSKIARRTAIIFALGLWLNAFPFTGPWFSHLRIPGVLQRIALCYGVAALIFLKARVKTQVWITAALLLGYWAMLKLIAAPGYARGDLTMEGSLASWGDRTLLTVHTYKPLYDPEGILSTIPAIATALLGVLAGQWLMQRREAFEKAAGLFAAGALCVIRRLCLELEFSDQQGVVDEFVCTLHRRAGAPIVGALFWAVDLKGYRLWAKPFVVFGVNALALYVLSGMLADLFTVVPTTKLDETEGNLKTWIYERVFEIVVVSDQCVAGICPELCGVLVVVDVGAVSAQDFYQGVMGRGNKSLYLILLDIDCHGIRNQTIHRHFNHYFTASRQAAVATAD